MESQFNGQQKEFLRFLQFLDDCGVLEHIIVCGSWAEFVYAQTGLLPGFTLLLRTLDIDFLIRNIRKPPTPVNLVALAKERGYTFDKDLLFGTTKMFTPNGMEIEFLIAQKGSGVDPVLKTNLGVHAQALRHLEILGNNVVVTDFLGLEVRVPEPEAYMLHKMVINRERTPAKQRKDARSVWNLIEFVRAERCADLFQGLTKKEKQAVRDFMNTEPEEITANGAKTFVSLKNTFSAG